nr:uncharacterized protein LOC106685606 [Halyomorpha halys]
MSKCCQSCGVPISIAPVSGWRVFFVTVAMLFPIGIALYNCTKWLEIKARIKKVKGKYKNALETKSELLLIENILKEITNTDSEHGGKGDGPTSVSKTWRRNTTNQSHYCLS